MMKIHDLHRQGAHIWERLGALVMRLDGRLRGRGSILVGAIRQMLAFRTTLWAASIAYFALLAIFPLTLLSIAIASYSFGPSADLASVIEKLEFLAPTLGDLMSENIAAIIRARGSVSAIASLALVWSASSLFRGLSGVLVDIWQAEFIRPYWQRNGIAITLILLLVGPFVLVALAAGSIVASLGSHLPESLHFLANGATVLLAIALDAAMFWLLYAAMPHGRGRWRDLLTGALVAGMLWELAKRAFVAFVGAYISRTNLVYGSVASIIAFLTWAYLSGLILLFGAYLSVACYRSRQSEDSIDSETHSDGGPA